MHQLPAGDSQQSSSQANPARSHAISRSIDGPMRPLYIKTAEKENMHDRLIIMDAVPYEDLAVFSRQAFIGLSIIQPISKSYEHALPNKLFEYAVSGLPMICSNLKAMAEMVEKYKHGIAIQYNSELEFHEAYQKILNNYILFNK